MHTATFTSSHFAQSVREVVQAMVLANDDLASFGAVASIDGDWISIDVPAANTDHRRLPATAWEYLIATKQLSGNVKWCLSSSGIQMRAEVAIDALQAEEVEPVVREAVLDVLHALRCSGPRQPPHQAPIDVEALAAAVQAEFTWSSSVRADGNVMFELASMGRGGHAELARTANGLRLSASLFREMSAQEAERSLAAAVFLLRCANSVRGCRAVADEEGVCGFEAILTGNITELHVHNALCALSAAVSHSRAEVHVLARNPEIARIYWENGHGFNAA